MMDTSKRLLFSIEETQHCLGDLGRTTLYRLINDGEITLVKIGRRSFVTSESLQEYVNRLTVAASEQS